MITLFAFALASLAWSQDAPPPPASAMVTSVYDGDTVTLETGDRIRLRWVNTPELKPAEDFGPEAGNFSRDLVGGTRVWLIMDPSADGSPPNPRDGYGRVVAGLCTVELVDGACPSGHNLSEELLSRGLAHLYIIPPDGSSDELKASLVAAQERARSAGLGIWSTDRYQGALHITSFHADAPGNDRDHPNGEYIRVTNVQSEPLDLSGFRVFVNDPVRGDAYSLPAIMVPPGHTVKLFSGKGVHQPDPAQQIEVYLTPAEARDERPLWANSGCHAYIVDAEGHVVDHREFTGH